MSDVLLSYVVRKIEDVEIDIKDQYKKALDEIRVELLRMEEEELFKASDVVKSFRLQGLEEQLANILNEPVSKVYDFIYDGREEVFITTMKNIIEGYGFSEINVDYTKAYLENPLYNSNFISDMKAVKGGTDPISTDLVKKISNEITQALIQGKSLPALTKKVKALMTDQVKRAVTIARTEYLRAMSLGKLEVDDQLLEQGFEIRKIWKYSYHTKYSREFHETMDKKEADDKGFFHVPGNDYIDAAVMKAPRLSGDPGHDVNCRCTYYTEIVRAD